MISLPSDGQSFMEGVMEAGREAYAQRRKEGPKAAARRADAATSWEKLEICIDLR